MSAGVVEFRPGGGVDPARRLSARAGAAVALAALLVIGAASARAVADEARGELQRPAGGVELDLETDPVEPPPSGDDIDLTEFQALFMGKTVYFELMDGTPWGREYYDPNGKSTVFVYWDGRCLAGEWAREGARYCFFYRDTPSCWLTFRDAGAIVVESEEGMRQRVEKIVSDEPLSCEPEAYSFVTGVGRGEL